MASLRGQLGFAKLNTVLSLLKWRWMKFRRKGIAEAISYASFKKAKALGAKKVILYSNTKNAGAIKLYEKIGFRHVQVEPGYKRANVKMVIDIETAIKGAKDMIR